MCHLTRYIQNDKQSLGVWVFAKNDLWVAKTLELPWKDNASNISCIPDGAYTCKYTRSNRLSKLKGVDVFTYELVDVPDRAGIRIHSANYFYQLLGCIAMGSALKDLNADGQLDVIHSGDTVDAFVKVMEKKDFILNIETFKG